VTPALINAMAQDHEAMCAAAASGLSSEYLAANRRFHFRLYEAAETVVMMPVIETMWMQIGPHLNQMFGGHKRAINVAEHHHADLLRALRRRDEQAVAQAIRDDLSDAADTILAANQFEE
jgi:DNA-binding GntR family transcriptional regulator